MKNINKSIENSEVVSILKTRTLFVLMIEQTLVKFEKEHSDLMCGYDEYGTVLELRDRKSKTLIGKWSIGELLCKALPFHDEIELCIIQLIKVMSLITTKMFEDYWHGQ